MSLEETTTGSEPDQQEARIVSALSAPPSPPQGGLETTAPSSLAVTPTAITSGVVPGSPFPSSDSLTARDSHSDGIWNESQATVLQAESTRSC